MIVTIPKVLAVLAIALSTACVQVEPKPDFDHTRELVAQSTGRQDVFDPYAAQLSDEELHALFADGLSLEEALRVALINNHELRADFQQIGIAHADWVQSRLLTNPSLDVLLRLPADGGRSMLEAAVGFELLELWRLPVRKQAARQQLDATVMRIARLAGEHLADTRAAYYEAVAAQELLQVAEENVALAGSSYEAVEALHSAGAADALAVNLARGPLLNAQLALRTAGIEAGNAKRELAKRLSIERSLAALVLSDELPAQAFAVADGEALVQIALGSRLDLRAIVATIEALDSRLDLEQRQAWGDVAVGPSLERPSGSGATLSGPALNLSLPIFDQNQAQVARASFELQQMLELHKAARIAIAQDVRSHAERVNSAALNLLFYDEELLPQAQRSLDLTREAYAAGQADLLAWVEAQRQLLEARRSHVGLRLEAARSCSDLERVVGAPLLEPSHP